MPDDAWFAVRCVFELHGTGHDKQHLYEERVTLWRAASFDDAIARAEADAAQFAADVNGSYLAIAQAFQLYEPPGDGEEVFSLLRESDLSPGAYVDAHFDTGTERQRDT